MWGAPEDIWIRCVRVRGIPFTEQNQESIPPMEWCNCQLHEVSLPPTDLDKKLAAFLKKRRGDMSFAQFSRIAGLPPSSLFRLEQCQQSLALKRLDRLLKRLKVSIVDVFGESKK